jgi:hypothetical protein
MVKINLEIAIYFWIKITYDGHKRKTSGFNKQLIDS